MKIYSKLKFDMYLMSKTRFSCTLMITRNRVVVRNPRGVISVTTAQSRFLVLVHYVILNITRPHSRGVTGSINDL